MVGISFNIRHAPLADSFVMHLIWTKNEVPHFKEIVLTPDTMKRSAHDVLAFIAAEQRYWEDTIDHD